MMSHQLDKYTKQPVKNFLDSIFHKINEIGIDVSTYKLDHICYRVSLDEDYMRFKKLLTTSADLLSESEINGRPICCFKLNEPIIYGNRKVDVFELPSPKLGSRYDEGYEHVEFVITDSLHDFVSKYPTLDFDKKGMKKIVNPDLRLQLGTICVKFHEQAIEEVIEIEKNSL